MAQKSIQKCAEVIEALKIVWPDFSMHTDDLNKPTPASVCKFYEKLLDVMGINIKQITMTLTEHMSNPDAYQDIIHCYVLYRCSRGFLERLKLTLTEPFTISDILRPNPKKTKIRVMLMANFLLYANNLMAQTLYPIEDRVKDELVQIDAMHKELDDLGTETNTLAVELSDAEKSLDKLEKEKEECLREYEEQKQMHESILQDIEHRKEESNELKTEESRLYEILRKEIVKEDELRQLVANDYETIAAERERLETFIAEAESHKSDYAVNLDIKNDAEVKYQTFAATVDEFIEQEPLDSILEIYKAQDTQKAFMEKMKEELQGLHTFQTDFHSISQKMQGEIDALQEELQATQLQFDAKQPALLQECKHLEAERETLVLKKTRNDNQTEKIERKIQYATDCCAQHERNMHELNEFHQKEYKKILQNTSILHNTVDQHLKEIKSNAEQINYPFISKNN